MRILVLVLAIVLLPLRGWMGGAMAMETAPAAVSQAAGAGADAMPPCHEAADAASAAHTAGHDAPGDASHHAQCSLCQLCHSAAMTGDAPAAPAAAPTLAQPQAPAQRFASALPQQADKPPIS
ncbi:DUF2946 family protein [Xenophilus sp.]|uniref:DUF2946 family protein n=1 Tax=Xenophilus sp. TaxID=1873499 RepID=UPI0037DC388F